MQLNSNSKKKPLESRCWIIAINKTFMSFQCWFICSIILYVQSHHSAPPKDECKGAFYSKSNYFETMSVKGVLQITFFFLLLWLEYTTICSFQSNLDKTAVIPPAHVYNFFIYRFYVDWNWGQSHLFALLNTAVLNTYCSCDVSMFRVNSFTLLQYINDFGLVNRKYVPETDLMFCFLFFLLD